MYMNIINVIFFRYFCYFVLANFSNRPYSILLLLVSKIHLVLSFFLFFFSLSLSLLYSPYLLVSHKAFFHRPPPFPLLLPFSSPHFVINLHYFIASLLHIFYFFLFPFI
ncbi:hypothetical protein F4703DRAFT_1156746 [Phycomyces blakesleeanus]